jgi:phosphatidylinositol kinase/protein kinase (PI-3  family)
VAKLDNRRIKTFKELQPRGRAFDLLVSQIDSAAMPAVLTSAHPLRLDARYDTDPPVKILGFSEQFKVADSGISRPKIIKCLGDNGQYYRQLVKGGDDTRQVMFVSYVLCLGVLAYCLCYVIL